MYDQSTNVLNSSQFINEDQPEQDAYKQALQNIEKVIYRQDNPEMDPTVINNLTHGLEAAQSNHTVIKNLPKQNKMLQTQLMV